MGVQRGSFQPDTHGTHDKAIQQVLQGHEVVTSSGFGALLPPTMRPLKGKIYVTTLRLAFVPDERSVTPVWCEPWNGLSQVRVKKGMMGATAFVTVNGFELGVDSTKSIAGDIERAWLHLRNVPLHMETAQPTFLPSIDVVCSGCGSQLRPGSASCGRCLRNARWPAPLDVLGRAGENPSALLPATFPDGSDTQREVIISGLSTFAVSANCTGEMTFIKQIALLVDAMKRRDPLPPNTFGEMPPLRGIGDIDTNRRFWDLARNTPRRLSS